jgi:two-component system, chemotaxis family, CheB/CheR fusion protein
MTNNDQPNTDAVAATRAPRTFVALVDYLTGCREFAFSAYAEPGLSRRLQREVPDWYESDPAAYLAQLRADPSQRTALAHALSVPQTRFFRDASTWSWLSDVVIPHCLRTSRAEKHRETRVWSAGCSTGQEAYSVAMVFANACDTFAALHVVGTDIDIDALAVARRGRYRANNLAEIPSCYQGYASRDRRASFAIRDRLRRSMSFSRHDLLTRMPLQRMDLILCRNTIMYFTQAGQARALAKLYLSMTSGGVLLLGKAENASASQLFTPLDVAEHAWIKAAGSENSDALKVLQQLGFRGPIRRNGKLS